MAEAIPFSATKMMSGAMAIAGTVPGQATLEDFSNGRRRK
jgi:hypothetical protein